MVRLVYSVRASVIPFQSASDNTSSRRLGGTTSISNRLSTSQQHPTLSGGSEDGSKSSSDKAPNKQQQHKSRTSTSTNNTNTNMSIPRPTTRGKNMMLKKKGLSGSKSANAGAGTTDSSHHTSSSSKRRGLRGIMAASFRMTTSGSKHSRPTNK